MAEDETNEQDLYDLIIGRLVEVGANELANETRQVVRRGTVIRGDEETSNGKTKALRPMQPNEALAVALEFLITALQVPLMVNEAKRAFECEVIVWHPDGPPDIVEEEQSLNSTKAVVLPLVEDADKPPYSLELAGRLSERKTSQTLDTSESTSLMPIPLDFDLTSFQDALKKVVKLKQELQFRYPEVV